jgi:hypothetical protein
MLSSVFVFFSQTYVESGCSPNGVCLMTEYRPFDIDPTSAAWDSQVSTAVLDVSQVHTQELDPPEYLRPPLPPLVPPPLERDPQTAAIAEHLRAAVRLNGEAYQVLDALKVCSAHANAAAERWFTHVTNAQRRTARQAAAYAELEAQVLTLSRQLAGLRQRHAARLAQARAHEDAARFIHSQHAPADPRR